MTNEFKLSYTASDINVRLGKIDNLAHKNELPTKISDLINDSDFVTKNYMQNYAQPVGDYALKSEIPTDYLTDWNANEGEPGYVSNRPFYSKFETRTLLEETTFVVPEDSSEAAIPSIIDLTGVSNVEVTYNGTKYVCSVTEDCAEGLKSFIFGDLSIMSEDGNIESTGEPFIAMFFDTSSAEMAGVPGIIMPLDGSTEFTVAIATQKEIIHQIPGKYIPSFDWNAAEGEEGHILNRTHYTAVGLVDILPETEPISEGEGSFIILRHIPYEEGKEYIINWNGTPYVCTAQKIEVAQDEDGNTLPFIILGDVALVDPEHYESSGIPFVIVNLPVELAGMEACQILSADGPTELTLSIQGYGEVYKKLDNKYLDLDWLPITKVGAVLLEETKLANGEYLRDRFVGEVTNGQVITVVYDNVQYECTVFGENDNYGAGNMAIIDETSPNTGEPFLFVYAGEGGGCFLFLDGSEHYVAIYDFTQTDSTIYNCIPRSFLPKDVQNTVAVANEAKTHADSAHAPSNAQANVIESIKVNGTAQTITSKAVNITVPTKASDIGAATAGHNHDDKYDAKGAAASALSQAQAYADSAATTVKNDLLNGAGSAYDTLKELSDLIVDNADTIDALEEIAAGKANATHTHAISDVSGLQTALDGKAASSHTHTVANISDLTATATELNYMDGVTSNVQAQLDGKAASNHNHSASNITSGKLSSDRLPTVPVDKGGTGATTAAGALKNFNIIATATELNYMDGVTSNVQTQLDGKSSATNLLNGSGDFSLRTIGASSETGKNAMAEGSETTASGDCSHAEGCVTTASGFYSHAEGYGNNLTTIELTGDASAKTYTVSADSSEIRVGRVLKYGARYATIETYDSSTLTLTTSATLSSTALSSTLVTLYKAIASGIASHAEGWETTASGDCSHAEGRWTIATYGATHAEGDGTTASGYASHAEGYETTASGFHSHAEGSRTTASSDYSHAEGSCTTASGENSHAEGSGTTASGFYSHAEGFGTTASGTASHAEGYDTTASDFYSHAEGFGAIAASSSQHVQGKYNIEDSVGLYAHIIGNGENKSSRSNAHTIDWDGNAWYAGSVEGTALILSSPGGKRFKITVDDTGTLTTTELT